MLYTTENDPLRPNHLKIDSRGAWDISDEKAWHVDVHRYTYVYIYNKICIVGPSLGKESGLRIQVVLSSYHKLALKEVVL